jgi:aryl-alcohol dehydrogenase-like predicted oxidoreductase
MRYRRFGHTRLRVSEIGFGTWGLGGTHGGSVAYGPTDDGESLAALRRAFDLGINFYDTSDFYGLGHSEELLGEAFAGLRRHVVIATKAGFVDAQKQDFSPRHLQTALDASLRRLRTDYVDLFLLHSPPLETLERTSETWDCVEKLRGLGKARAVGISVRSPDDGLAVVAQFAPDAIEVNFNLADQRALQNGLFERCAHQGIGVIVRTPLCFGFLTGAFASQEVFEESDHRARWSPEQRVRWNEATDLFRTCAEGQTPAQFALRYCLSQAGVSTAIPGMLCAEHVEENAAASDRGPLSAEALSRTTSLYESQTFFLKEKGRSHAAER